MALFTVSNPKPECSRSNSAKSQPADFRIWPMPGVANSTMKWPNFGALLPARDLRPRSVMVPCSLVFRPLGSRAGRCDDRRRLQCLAGAGIEEGGAAQVDVDRDPLARPAHVMGLQLRQQGLVRQPEAGVAARTG